MILTPATVINFLEYFLTDPDEKRRAYVKSACGLVYCLQSTIIETISNYKVQTNLTNV